MSARTADDHGFSPRLIAGVVAIGIVAFIALWALIALGPQLSSGNDGGGHALSKAAPGYAAIVDLAERSGSYVELRRTDEGAEYDDYTMLVVLTPRHDNRPEEIADLLRKRGGPVLVVLPKWQTMRLPGEDMKPGWVSAGVARTPPVKLLPPDIFGKLRIRAEPAPAQTVRATLAGREVTAALPANAQTIEGETVEVLVPGTKGGAVLSLIGDSGIYVLADPDLINNIAFASRDGARAAVTLVDAIAEDAEADGMGFDVTLNGFGGQRSLLRFAFVPPFIGITLCLIAAGLLALWQAWMRFGPALKPDRAIPVSKAALIANSADLIRQARRELDGADAYVSSQRSAIARRLHAPEGLDEAATDAWIDRHLRGGEPFSALARRLPLARNRHEFLADAQALHDIRKDLIRDS